MTQRNIPLRCRAPRGFSYVEILVAALILVIVGASTLSTLAIARKAADNKRLTEMGIYVAYAAAERIRAQGFLNIPEISAAAPNYLYYDTNGAFLGSYEKVGSGMQYYDANHNTRAAAPAGIVYSVTWSMVTTDTNGDGVLNAKDMRTLSVQSWNSNLTMSYESLQLAMALGGV